MQTATPPGPSSVSPSVKTPSPPTSAAASSPASPVVDYVTPGRRKVPLGQRVNLRLIAFMTVIAVPFLAIFGVFLVNEISGGKRDHGSYVEVDLKALGNFPFNNLTGTIENVPPKWRELDGRKVQLEGFMYSPRSAGSRGTEFQFVYSVTKCCFNGPPQVQERVYGHVPEGSSVPLYDMFTFVRLTGTLHVRVQRGETGEVYSVFDMDVEKAEQI